MRFSPVRGADLIPDTVCKSRSCWQILSRLRADLRENPTKQWASRDALIQSAGSISNSARYHSDANIALGPILKMYVPGQIRISNALNSDGYSTGIAPPSGNNDPVYNALASYERYIVIYLTWQHWKSFVFPQVMSSTRARKIGSSLSAGYTHTHHLRRSSGIFVGKSQMERLFFCKRVLDSKSAQKYNIIEVGVQSIHLVTHPRQN